MKLVSYKSVYTVSYVIFGMLEKIVWIRGMYCKNCTESIETKLSRLKGIEKVKVDIIEENAIVKYDPKQISLDVIKEEIIDLGYDIAEENGKIRKKRNTNFLQGIFYGLVPHTGCIAFIIATILGVTAATEFFKPLLMNPYFFYILIGISFGFATISSLFYLKKQGFIRFDRGANGFEMIFSKNILKRKWKYLSTMYGTTIFINVFLFFFIFPVLANVDSNNSMTGSFIENGGSIINLEVKIPCPGHAPLITGELKTIEGVRAVKFRFPNFFDVSYDPSLTSEEEILSLDVFETYNAIVLDNVKGNDVEEVTPLNGDSTDTYTGSCGGSCGESYGGCGCGG